MWADEVDDQYEPRYPCGKIPYVSRKAARRDAHRRIVPSGGRMRAYRCERCPYWHVGHLPDLVRTGQLTSTEFYRLAARGDIPLPGQRPIDMTDGVMTPQEVADAFRVGIRAVYAWARAYQANNPDSDHGQLAAAQTPGGRWRFSRKAVLVALENGQHGQ